MSRIPFVNQLADELERAAERATRSRRRRLRPRRFGAIALAGALLVSGSAFATGLLSGDPEQRATNNVSCYDGADPEFAGSVASIPPAAGASSSPLELCRHELGLGGRPVPPLVACADGTTVAVVPGRGADDCRREGFAPLADGYRPARARIARLERQIVALEASADCIAPDRLVRQVQALLRRQGWDGWTAAISASRAGNGRCGTVSYVGGDDNRHMTGAVDWEGRRILVGGTAPRHVDAAVRELFPILRADSGTRCHTVAELTERVQRAFASRGIPVKVSTGPVTPGTALDNVDGRWTRYLAGCAVIAGAGPDEPGNSVLIALYQRGARSGAWSAGP